MTPVELASLDALLDSFEEKLQQLHAQCPTCCNLIVDLASIGVVSNKKSATEEEKSASNQKLRARKNKSNLVIKHIADELQKPGRSSHQHLRLPGFIMQWANRAVDLQPVWVKRGIKLAAGYERPVFHLHPSQLVSGAGEQPVMQHPHEAVEEDAATRVDVSWLMTHPPPAVGDFAIVRSPAQWNPFWIGQITEIKPVGWKPPQLPSEDTQHQDELPDDASETVSEVAMDDDVPLSSLTAVASSASAQPASTSTGKSKRSHRGAAATISPRPTKKLRFSSQVRRSRSAAESDGGASEGASSRAESKAGSDDSDSDYMGDDDRDMCRPQGGGAALAVPSWGRVHRGDERRQRSKQAAAATQLSDLPFMQVKWYDASKDDDRMLELRSNKRWRSREKLELCRSADADSASAAASSSASASAAATASSSSSGAAPAAAVPSWILQVWKPVRFKPCNPDHISVVQPESLIVWGSFHKLFNRRGTNNFCQLLASTFKLVHADLTQPSVVSTTMQQQ